MPLITQTIKFTNAFAEIHQFDGSNAGVEEYHVILHIDTPTLTYAEQLEAILEAYFQLQRDVLPDSQPIFKRYFLSDAANQTPLLLDKETENPMGALSIIEQAPLDGTKIALYAYFMTGVKTRALASSSLFEAAHGNYRHLWQGGLFNLAKDSRTQTNLIFNDYIMQLAEQGCTLADNCVRTWFFVSDIDNKYSGMVTARNQTFATQNLTDATHYIASTGIGGRQADPKVYVQMDAYAVAGLEKGQMNYIYALDHLNRTSDYGVSFERGTTIDYGDRRHTFISGTASIDNKGQILHAGDITKQTERMIENVEALLNEAGNSFDDVTHMIIYLRDTADYAVVKKMFDTRFPNHPKVFVHAPVCRPGWLIEMECMAIKSQNDARFKPL